jgi:uncharacterized membrane protein
MNITNTILGIGILLFGGKTLLASGKSTAADIVFSVLIILAVTWFMLLIYLHQKEQMNDEKFKDL